MSGKKRRRVRVLFFGQFRDAAGRTDELVSTSGAKPDTAGEWYDRFAGSYGFGLDRTSVQAALNGRYVAWDARVEDGDELALIPQSEPSPAR